MTDISLSEATRAPASRATGRLREALVHASMILVAVTLAIASHRTLGIGQIPSLCIALGAYWSMLLMHALVLRRQEMLALWVDMDRIVAENAQLRRLIMRPPPPHQPMPRPLGPPANTAPLSAVPASNAEAPQPIKPADAASSHVTAPAPVSRAKLLPTAVSLPGEPATVPYSVPQPASGAGEGGRNSAAKLPASDSSASPSDEMREREVALMQSLIKELADQIKGSAGGPGTLDKAAQRMTAEARPEAPTPRSASQDYHRLAEVAAAVDAERVELCLEPILGLEDRKARHFEISLLLRSEDGTLLDPAEMAEAMAGTGLVPRLETTKLTRAIRLASALSARGARSSLFSSISEESLRDDSFRLSVLSTGTSERADGCRLVMSVAQSEVRGFAPAHWSAIEALGRRGLHFALVDVVDLDMDFETLKARGFHFIRLDAPVFLHGLPAPHGFVPASDLCRHLAALGFTLIVSRISDEAALAKVQGFGAALGQGQLFGGRRPVRLDG